MADLRLYLVKREHLGLAAKAGLIFGVVDLDVACCDNQDHAVVGTEGQRFRDARGLAADGLRGQLNRGRGCVKFQYTSVRAELAQPVFAFSMDILGSSGLGILAGQRQATPFVFFLIIILAAMLRKRRTRGQLVKSVLYYERKGRRIA